MIAETASSEAGGEKAAWIADAFEHQLPANFPAVRGVVWFDERTSADWPIDTSPTAEAAFRAAAINPYLAGTLP